MSARFDVVVVGSLHLDIMIVGSPLPAIDETVMGKSWGYKCGGKGGNQAVAAAKFDAKTAMVGRIGDDDFGRRLTDNLNRVGVDRSSVVTDYRHGSGMSCAIVDDDGNYGASVVSGANLHIDPAQFTDLTSRVLLLQNEIVAATSKAAAAWFGKSSAYVIHNAAPYRASSKPFAELCHLIVVNRVEAAALTGVDVINLDKALKAALLIADGKRDAIVTAGEFGVAVVTKAGEARQIAPHRVKAISSHGAGDFFMGALAARIARGEDLFAAAKFANRAAALFVSSTPQEQDVLNSAAVLAALT